MAGLTQRRRNANEDGSSGMGGFDPNDNTSNGTSNASGGGGGASSVVGDGQLRSPTVQGKRCRCSYGK